MRRLWLFLFFISAACYGQTDPTQFVFGSFSTIPPYNNTSSYTQVADAQIMPANLVTDNNTFTSTSHFTNLFNDYTGSSFSVSANTGTVSTPAQTGRAYWGSNASSHTYPVGFVQVEIDHNGFSGGGNNSNPHVGWYSGTNYIAAEFAPAQAWIEFHYGGSDHVLAVTNSFVAPSAPWRIGFGLIANQEASAWYATCATVVSGACTAWNGWQLVTSLNPSTFPTSYDLTTIGNVSGWLSGFGVDQGGAVAASWTFSNLKTGTYGGVGIKDIHVVINPDGTPYVIGTTSYQTAALNGPYGTYEVLFSFDLNTHAFQMLSVLLVNRSGHYYIDTVGEIIYNTITGTQQGAFADWATANGSPVMEYGSWSAGTMNVLTPGYYALPLTTPITTMVPGQTSDYDPFMVCTSFNYTTGACANWLLAFTGSFGLPALQQSTVDPSADTWTLVGHDSSGCEGSHIECMVVSGAKQYFPAWGCVVNSTLRGTRVYSSSFSFLGSLNVTLPPAGGDDEPPHANLFAFGTTEYFLTFDDTNFGGGFSQNMGNLILATASLTTANSCFASNPGISGPNSTIQGLSSLIGGSVIQ